MRAPWVFAAFALILSGLPACSRSEAQAEKKGRPPAATNKAVGPVAPSNQVRFVTAEKGPVDSVVRGELARAHTEGRDILVYVGATWCEPCKRFHEAANNGELDSAFPGLTLVEFDADSDGERLAEAGYVSRLIPLFCAPKPDGHASDFHMEGSIKGGGAVAEIVPRLRGLLESARRIAPNR